VVSTPLSSFGRDTAGIVTASPTDARVVLNKALAQNDTVRILPTYQELDGKVSTQIKSERPRNTIASTKRVGAAIRNADGGPMDRVLQNTKIRGDRDPIRPEPLQSGVGEPRKTGAVTREPVVRTVIEDAPVRPERSVRTAKPDRDDPVRSEPVFTPTKPRNDRGDDPVRPAPRVEEPQKQRDEPVRTPRNDPPPTRSEPVRSEPPRTESPRKSDPPPTKSEPKSEPSKPSASERKSKDILR